MSPKDPELKKQKRFLGGMMTMLEQCKQKNGTRISSQSKEEMIIREHRQ